MSSDGRSRDGDRLRRRRVPSDPTQSSQESARSQPRRRRTSYVPRQGSAQPRRFGSERPQSAPERDPRAPRRAQPPSYRQDARPTTDDFDYHEAPDDEDAYLEESPSRPPPRRSTRATPSPRQSRYQLEEEERYRSSRAHDIDSEDEYADQYDDSFIDEDDWYEEEAAAGAARPRPSRTRSREGRRVTAPTISLPRPSLPRPTVPNSIREAAIVQDQNAIILSAGLLLSVMLLALFTSNRADTLAPGFATHVSASGLQEHFRSESALWQLPLMAGALLLMNGVLAWFMAQRSRFLSRFFLITVALVHVLVWVAFLRIAY